MKAFIALLYLRGALGMKSFPLDLLWSEQYGIAAFRDTMARNQFRDIKRYLRLDDK